MKRSGRGPDNDHDPVDPEACDSIDLTVLPEGFVPPGKRSAPSAEAALPPHIGQYRILSFLGRGGMGVVYEAEQSDPRRRVALKVVRGGRFVDEQLIRLFHREARSLARLSHPNIATIYEAGRTDAGEHFFAMELVRGVTLDRFVRERKLGRRERLELFRKTCDAINYAHQRGVIHRDLKPSNILVQEDGSPKVLDFGLARITDQDVNATTVFSETGRLAGTLTHMSPEQTRANPDEIDLRTDVYSLGVVLYELMTDRLPYAADQSGLSEILNAICDRPPPPPASIDRALRGDLETIILCALEKDPARRYASVAALGEDVRRYLSNEPILARPPSGVYQLRKLVARHRLTSALLATLFLLTVGFGVWTYSLYRAERERHRQAREAETRATLVSDFMVGLFDVSDPDVGLGRTVTARELLDAGAGKIGEELADQPDSRATLMQTMGTVYRTLGEYEQATRLLRETLQVRRELHGEQHPAVASALHDLGWSLKSQGDFEAAEEYLSRALTMRRELLPPTHPDLANSLLVLGALYRERGRYADAQALLQESLSIQRDDPERDRIEMSKTIELLGKLTLQRGDLERAEQLYRESLAIREELLDPHHPYVANNLGSLAGVLRAQGRYADAESLARQALAIRRQTLEPDHRYTASAMLRLGAILVDRQDHAAAEPLMLEALEAYRRRLPADHWYTAAAWTHLGQVQLDVARYADAETSFRTALRIYRDKLGEKHVRFADPLVGLARCSLAAGDLATAETWLRQAIEVYRHTLPPGDWKVASAQSLLGECLAGMGQCAEARALLQAGSEAMSALRGDDDRYVQAARRRLTHGADCSSR